MLKNLGHPPHLYPLPSGERVRGEGIPSNQQTFRHCQQMKVLVTGGAGFIGSHLTDLLVQEGFDVRVLDNLDPQVHPDGKPGYLNPAAEFIQADVRDREPLFKALSGCEAIVHLAAAVGVGQSQYRIRHYMETNAVGTAQLFDILANEKHRVAKILVAASMSSYGEGRYLCAKCGLVKPGLRPEEQMALKEWEPYCPSCHGALKPVPTSEETPQDCNSIYALTKRIQEETALIFGRTYRIPTVALRFFNAYGSRQSLSNPYTGVTAIFLSRLKAGQPPVVYEDGGQTRDFISVKDVCRAMLISLRRSEADYRVFNVGSSRPLPIAELARILSASLGLKIEPQITLTFRKGDVRHCFADITRIRETLGWQPEISFEKGIEELIAWAAEASSEDRFLQAQAEMADRGLI